MQRKSYSNLAALAAGDFSGAGAGASVGELQGGGPLSHAAAGAMKGSATSMDDMADGRKSQRCAQAPSLPAALLRQRRTSQGNG